MPRWWGGVREPWSWILAIIALTFSVGKIWNVTNPSFYTGPYFIGILVAFIAHELAHRGVARMYGLYSEFIAVPVGLLITFLTGFIPGLVILTPGYVGVYAPGPRGWRGAIRSVEAGPAANIILGLIVLAAGMVAPPYWHSYLRIVAEVNFWVALFNLLPIPPLDGAKIARRDPLVWALLFAASLIFWWIP